MDLKVYTSADLANLRKMSQSEKDERMVRRIVQQIHSYVLAWAKDGKHEYKWNSDVYPFDNFQEYDVRHIVEACAQLQALFPDAEISRPRTKEILMRW